MPHWLFCFLLLFYSTSSVFGARKRSPGLAKSSPDPSTDDPPCKRLASASNTYGQLQLEGIQVCQDYFDSLFLEKFKNDTGIEANSINWNLLRGCLPEGFVIPTEDWSLDDMRVLMCYYYRVRFFSIFDEDLVGLFKEECARLRKPPPPFRAQCSPEMLKSNTDKEGREFALAFDLLHFGSEEKKSENSRSGCRTESILHPMPTHTYQLGKLQNLLAEKLLDKYKRDTNSLCKHIPWTLCSTVGLPANIDLSNVAQVRWALRNIYRFRFFTPHQEWMKDMFAKDLAKLPLSAAIATDSHEPSDYNGLQLERKYNSILYEISPPRLPSMKNDISFKISDAEKCKMTKKVTITMAVKFFDSRLLKDSNVNINVGTKVIIIGLPPSIMPSASENWTVSQFQEFLSHYYRIRIFRIEQAKLAKEYAEQVQALPPPPLVEKFTIANGELITGPYSDTEGQRLRQEWNSPSAAGTNSEADDVNANFDAITSFANALVHSSQCRSKLCDAFYSVFLEKFKHETGKKAKAIDWHSQPHAGYPINLYEDNLIYFSESVMLLFFRHFYRIRFFSTGQEQLQAEYVERLAKLPKPPQNKVRHDIFGIALQAEFDKKISRLSKGKGK